MFSNVYILLAKKTPSYLEGRDTEEIYLPHTGKSFSEALILVSANPQYDKRLFIELRVQYMKIPSSEHLENMLCTQIVFCFCFDTQNNLSTQHVLNS